MGIGELKVKPHQYADIRHHRIFNSLLGCCLDCHSLNISDLFRATVVFLEDCERRLGTSIVSINIGFVNILGIYRMRSFASLRITTFLTYFSIDNK